MRVIIVGAGLGGLALATALTQAGMDTMVIEQAAAFGEAGGGIQLSPNATRALFSLGLEAEVLAIGFAPETAVVRDHRTDRLLLRNVLGEVAETRWGAPYLQVHRARLHAMLLAAVHRLGRTTFRLGARAMAMEDGAVVLDTGERLTADAVIGCDGVRSSVAAALFGQTPARFTGQVAWRGLVPVDRLPPGTIGPCTQVWTGPKRHFVCYPMGDGDLINFVAVTEEDWRIESWSEPGDRNTLLAAFNGWPAAAQALIADADALVRWALYDRPPMARWTKGRATLLGDAAHPMLPFLAQGAAMGIEDAVVMARCLAESEVELALLRYEAARRGRTAKVQAWSRRNATLFHLPGPLAATAFGAAQMLDAIKPGGAAARFDWLYGYDAATARL